LLGPGSSEAVLLGHQTDCLDPEPLGPELAWPEQERVSLGPAYQMGCCRQPGLVPLVLLQEPPRMGRLH